MKRMLRTFAALLLGVVASRHSATAQCVPDGLDGGPCCTATQPNYPFVPRFQQDTLGICWENCDPVFVSDCRAVWGTPAVAFNPCRVQRMDLTLKSGSVTKWKGRMLLTYSRTWLEVDAAGNELQVWRYLVNGNLNPTAAAGPFPCPVPPCAAAFGKVRFTGYLDYVRDCFGPRRQFAWMISHQCDRIDHAPGFPRAGAFHPEHSYTFVGPAAGFIVTPLVPIEGGATALEAVRRQPRVPGVGLTCEFEEQIQGDLNPIQQFCLCGPAAATPQWSLANMLIFGACGTFFNSPGGPFLPGFLSQGIGFWTDPLTYPGEEQLRWNAGGYDYVDPCTGVAQPEVFFGVTTLFGYPARQILSGGGGGPLPPVFVDQGNSLRGGATIMNTPYESDHIVNLNF